MKRAVVVINAGSSSIKYALYADTFQCLAHGTEEGQDHAGMLAHVLARVQAEANGWQIAAAGHRVAHGGDRFAAPTIVDNAVLKQLEKLCTLAPLHQRYNLAGIRAVAAHLPGVAQVACFDTAFHQTQDEIARLYALPGALADKGIKRYGFHGLSYEYIARRLRDIPFLKDRRKVIVAHLGNGASLCALRDGQSVATTMGFTTLDGLMMGTRSGSVDPGVLLYLLEHGNLSGAALAHLLYEQSGLLGVSGISHDMRILLASKAPGAQLAINLFCYRIVREIGSLAAALGGVDALVFTGGIGEHAASVRQKICEPLGWLGVETDPIQSRVAIAVVRTNEEEMIARHTLETVVDVAKRA